MQKWLLNVLLIFLFLSCAERVVPTRDVNAMTPMDADSGPALQRGAVITFEYLKTKPGQDAADRNNFVQLDLIPAWREQMPGSQVYYAQGERGVHEGSDVLIRIFADRDTHNRYFKDGKMPTKRYEEAQAALAPMYTDETFGRYFSGVDESLAEAYEIMETGKPITRNWMRPGTILGYHPLELKPGVDKGKFEKFVRDIWAPTRSDALPDSKVIYLKGVSGSRQGEYSYIWLIESEDTRDYYFPSTAEPSRFFEEFSSVWQEIEGPEFLGKYLAEGGQDPFTDYLLVE